jgi:hypothetical protein
MTGREGIGVKMTSKLGMALAVVVGLGGVGSAFASWVTFDIEWDGSVHGNGASATGFITFDDTLVPQIVDPADPPDDVAIHLPSAAIADLGITITGASIGNGSFGLDDFDRLVFYAPIALDLTKELIGQSLGTGCNFGDDDPEACGANENEDDAGDFNLFAKIGSGAPNGVWFFNLQPAGSSDGMLVTSMTPRQVPEPGTLALFGLGLAGLGAMRRKKLAA